MSNRAYLYSTNFVPGAETDDRRIVGICEWANDIPIVFKLLVSANPNSCRSLIWDDPKVLAVTGDYEEGVAQLMRFLDRVPHPSAPQFKDEAEVFLSAEDNKNRYFVLEPEEVFWLGGDPQRQQLQHLLKELADLRLQMDKVIADLKARMYEEDNPPGFFARLFGARAPTRRSDSTDMVLALGLGGWSNLLFHQPQ